MEKQIPLGVGDPRCPHPSCSNTVFVYFEEKLYFQLVNLWAKDVSVVKVSFLRKDWGRGRPFLTPSSQTGWPVVSKTSRKQASGKWMLGTASCLGIIKLQTLMQWKCCHDIPECTPKMSLPWIHFSCSCYHQPIMGTQLSASWYGIVSKMQSSERHHRTGSFEWCMAFRSLNFSILCDPGLGAFQETLLPIFALDTLQKLHFLWGNVGLWLPVPSSANGQVEALALVLILHGVHFSQTLQEVLVQVLAYNGMPAGQLKRFQQRHNDQDPTSASSKTEPENTGVGTVWNQFVSAGSTCAFECVSNCTELWTSEIEIPAVIH